MSATTNGTRTGRKPYLSSKSMTPSQSCDELGTWSCRQLLSMDQRFCERVERAFRSGRENRQSAAGVSCGTFNHARLHARATEKAALSQAPA
jgi:hypothetical protein